MNESLSYIKALELLNKVAGKDGFLASAQNISNYKRVWARDGVICGLAALASGEENLIKTFKNTLETLGNNQHKNGSIPSNVMINGAESEVSYGGLAGRVDAVTWFIIGVCQYVYHTKDLVFLEQYKSRIEKAFQLLEAWEFNNKHFIYVPLSGNWADEYITDGYVLYDQLLRIWALKSYNYFENDNEINIKIKNITHQIEINFTPNSDGNKYHEKAYNQANINHYMPASFSPAGYKTQFDAFANALALILNIGNADFQNSVLDYFEAVVEQNKMGMVPAFYPTIHENDLDWQLLKNNCKYEFRNFPNEFHNGGNWSMVNGFYGVALVYKNKIDRAQKILSAIDNANAVENYSFYENFNSMTSTPNGVPFCAWSAAATVLLNNVLNNNFKFLI